MTRHLGMTSHNLLNVLFKSDCIFSLCWDNTGIPSFYFNLTAVCQCSLPQ